MYNPSDVDNIDYVLIISFSKILCKREDLTVTSTVKPAYIQFYSIRQTLISSVITGIYEVTVSTISIVAHLSNTFAKTSRCCPY